jgi:hypothetical protein
VVYPKSPLSATPLHTFLIPSHAPIARNHDYVFNIAYKGCSNATEVTTKKLGDMSSTDRRILVVDGIDIGASNLATKPPYLREYI